MRPKVIYECLTTSWPRNSMTLPTLMLRLMSQDQYLSLAEDCEKTSSHCAVSSTFELRTLINIHLSQTGKSNLYRVNDLQHCWSTWIPGMLCRSPWLLGLGSFIYCGGKKKIHLQTMGGWTALLGNSAHQMHRISTAAFDSWLWFTFVNLFYRWPPHFSLLAPTVIKFEKKL